MYVPTNAVLVGDDLLCDSGQLMARRVFRPRPAGSNIRSSFEQNLLAAGWNRDHDTFTRTVMGREFWINLSVPDKTTGELHVGGGAESPSILKRC
jgi:hypothetical protein